MSIIRATFLGEAEHFSGKIGAFWWSIFVGKRKHNVQKPSYRSRFTENKTAISRFVQLQP